MAVEGNDVEREEERKKAAKEEGKEGWRCEVGVERRSQKSDFLSLSLLSNVSHVSTQLIS
jgi:hypothetical protein